MLPLRTDRLMLRVMQPSDAATVAVYRSDPAVAELQDWPLPYTEAMALERLTARSATLDSFDEGTNLAIEAAGHMVGDVYVHLHDGLAEVGWTLARSAQGRGYATEAATALVEALFTKLDAHRIEASLHPDNIASARVCEAIGMVFESRSRLNFRGRNGWEDDVRYALLRADWEAWVARPRTPPTSVELVEITPDDAYLWGRLSTHHSQQNFVATMPLSFRDALFPEVIDGAPVVPWMRGVLADGERVGFTMMAEVTDHHPEPFLWRLLVDRMHQRRGIGERIMALLVERVREQGHTTLLTSYEEGPGGPAPFYHRLGFVPTGNLLDGEIETRLTLAS